MYAVIRLKNLGAFALAAILLTLASPAWAEYLVNGNVVTDTETGLMWMQETAEVGQFDNVGWQAALSCCEDSTYGGYSDWRLPNIRELDSIVDLGRHDPAIDPVFSCQHDYYWSSSPYTGGFGSPWRMDFRTGQPSNFYRFRVSSWAYVRCVRGVP